MKSIEDIIARIEVKKKDTERVNTDLVKSLAEMYAAGSIDDAAVIAKLCDEHLDRSGRLLGEVRKLAYAIQEESC